MVTKVYEKIVDGVQQVLLCLQQVAPFLAGGLPDLWVGSAAGRVARDKMVVWFFWT